MALQRWIFGLSSFALGAVVITLESDVRTAGDHSGYAPDQPIAYSHRLHAGELQIPCLYCHYGAQTSRHAGIPSATVCMTCHKSVTAGFDAQLAERQAAEAENRDPQALQSPELRKLYDSLALDAQLDPIAGREPTPIAWQRVHAAPDFVYFDHRAHVTRGVACESCHGPVQAMERVRQESTLSMGWCVACHRASPSAVGAAAGAPDGPRVEQHVSTDCISCHY